MGFPGAIRRAVTVAVCAFLSRVRLPAQAFAEHGRCDFNGGDLVFAAFDAAAEALDAVAAKNLFPPGTAEALERLAIRQTFPSRHTPHSGSRSSVRQEGGGRHCPARAPVRP